MLQNICHLNPQPEDIPELKSALVKIIWDALPQEAVCSLQVDREFQEASVSLCKRRWRTFWHLL